MKKIVGLALMLSLTACSSLSEKDCQTGDWAGIGQRDGSKGYAKTRIQSHVEACGEYGITPDRAAYDSGYNNGIKVYCTNSGKVNGEKGDLTNTPSMCLSSKEFMSARSAGFESFCGNQGVHAGSNGNKSLGRSDCQSKRSFKTGYKTGLKTYCSFDKGQSFGTTAADHNAGVCTRKLRKQFLAGYKRGLLDYCTRNNGFNLGKSKTEHKATKCPHNLKYDFENAYKKGIQYNELKRQMDDMNKEIAKIQRKLKNPKMSADLRRHLKRELRTKKKKQTDITYQTAKIEGFVGL